MAKSWMPDEDAGTQEQNKTWLPNINEQESNAWAGSSEANIKQEAQAGWNAPYNPVDFYQQSQQSKAAEEVLRNWWNSANNWLQGVNANGRAAMQMQQAQAQGQNWATQQMGQQANVYLKQAGDIIREQENSFVPKWKQKMPNNMADWAYLRSGYQPGEYTNDWYNQTADVNSGEQNALPWYMEHTQVTQPRYSWQYEQGGQYYQPPQANVPVYTTNILAGQKQNDEDAMGAYKEVHWPPVVNNNAVAGNGGYYGGYGSGYYGGGGYGGGSYGGGASETRFYLQPSIWRI